MSRYKNESSPMTDFGSFVREKRKELGLTQLQLHHVMYPEKYPHGTAYVSYLEAGKHRQFSHDFFRRLAKALNQNEHYLIGLAKIEGLLKPDKAQKLAGLARLIYESRMAAGFTSRSALAEKAGVSLDTIEKCERGRRKRITLQTATKLAETLGISLGQFVPYMRPRTGRILTHTKAMRSKTPLGAVIRTARIQKNISQGDLAKKMGCTAKYISRVELGLAPLSSNKARLEEFAKYLGLPVGELLKVQPKRRRRVRQTNPLIAETDS